MAYVGVCGHVRDPDLSKPCRKCQRAEEEREWERKHPDKEKYLREAGWKMVFLEGKAVPLGWYKKEAGNKIYNLFEAVKEQRRREKDYPSRREERY
jgi:hypothetical protein